MYNKKYLFIEKVQNSDSGTIECMKPKLILLKLNHLTEKFL